MTSGHFILGGFVRERFVAHLGNTKTFPTLYRVRLLYISIDEGVPLDDVNVRMKGHLMSMKYITTRLANPICSTVLLSGPDDSDIEAMWPTISDKYFLC